MTALLYFVTSLPYVKLETSYFLQVTKYVKKIVLLYIFMRDNNISLLKTIMAILQCHILVLYIRLII